MTCIPRKISSIALALLLWVPGAVSAAELAGIVR